MNDDFLYRLRTEPPAHFATALKGRLDRSTRRGARVLRIGLGLLIFGTAFAVVSPAVRHSIVEAVQWMRGAATPEPAAPDAQAGANRSNQGLARAFGDRTVEPAGGDANGGDSGDPAADGIGAEARSRTVPNRAARNLAPSGLPRLTQSAPDERAGTDAANSDTDAGGQAGNSLTDDRGAGTSQDEPAADSPGFIVTGPLLSEPGTAARAFETRRALFTVMQWTMESIDRLVTAQNFAPAQAEPLARRMGLLASMLDEQFLIDERNQNIETRALHDVWERRREFRQRAEEFSQLTHAMQVSAARGNRLQVLRNAAELRGACAGCHLEFRKGGNRNVGSVYP